MTPSWAMWRSRSVPGRAAPKASTTSWPCAQHSMSRAVRNDLALSGGPSQATRVLSSRRAAASASPRGLPRHASSRSGGERWRCRVRASASSPASRSRLTDARKASGSTMAVTAAPSKYVRCPIWSATLQPGLGVARRQSSSVRPATIASSASCSARRSPATSESGGRSLIGAPFEQRQEANAASRRVTHRVHDSLADARSFSSSRRGGPQAPQDQLDDRIGRLLRRCPQRRDDLGAGVQPSEAGKDARDGRRVDVGDVAALDGEVEQGARHVEQVLVVTVLELLGGSHGGEVAGERLAPAANGERRRLEVGAHRGERGDVVGDGLASHAADPPQLAVDDHEHQLVPARGQGVERTQRAVEAPRQLGHRQLREAGGEDALHLVEQLALPVGQPALTLTIEHGTRPAHGLKPALHAFDDGGTHSHPSRPAGISTMRARSHSPRLFACASWRVDAATPPCSRPWITKLSALRVARRCPSTARPAGSGRKGPHPSPPRDPSSQAHPSSWRANTPRWALPPLSPERAPTTRPSGAATVPPAGITPGPGAGSVGRAAAGVGATESTTVPPPPSTTTCWGTSSAGTTAGRY